MPHPIERDLLHSAVWGSDQRVFSKPASWWGFGPSTFSGKDPHRGEKTLEPTYGRSPAEPGHYRTSHSGRAFPWRRPGGGWKMAKAEPTGPGGAICPASARAAEIPV